MKSYSRYLICVTSLLMAAVLPASAGSTSGSYTGSVTGVGVTGETVTATFTFNNSTNQFIDISLVFKGGVFNGVKEDYKSCGKGLACSFNVSVSTSKGSDSIVYALSFLNKTLSQYAGAGTISTIGSAGVFGYRGYASVPEGGSRFSYLAPAAFLIFGGIFLSGFTRPRVDRRESV